MISVKTWTQALDSDPEKPGPRKICTMKNMGNNWMQAKDCKIRYDLLKIKFAKKRLVSKPSEK